MKPRAKKFRIRRSSTVDSTGSIPPLDSVRTGAPAGNAAASSGQGQQPAQARRAAPATPRAGQGRNGVFDTHEDGFGDQVFETARASGPASGPASGQSGGRAAGIPAAPHAPQSPHAPQAPRAQQSPAATGTNVANRRASSMAQMPSGQQQGPSGTGTDVQINPGAEVEAIRNEGLTGRQLRMARRIAQKHGLNPASDYDAVRLLRRRGIDPFQRANMLELVVAGQDGARSNPDNLPQTMRAPAPPPALPPADAEARRANEIRRIQRDIVKRRRRSMGMLFARLAFFVLLPTLIAGYYYTKVATPLYATNSQFVIQQAESAGGSPLGGLFSGTTFATSQDSIAVQSYMQSRDAMLRLDRDLGFKAHFMDPDVDPIQRLPADSTNEDAYALYKKHVKIGYDPSEGVIKMEVAATDPATSVAFSKALISYAEEQVDHLTSRLRKDQMAGARESYDDAETKMIGAQQRVVQLQEARGILSAEAESSMVMGQINTFEIELQQERLRLAEQKANPRPNRTRVAVMEGNIARLEQVITDLRSQLTEGADGGTSLARITGELMVAQADLETRQLMLQQSLQQMENARVEANRQVRYLSLAVSPVESDKPSYPRAFENTALAFLIFAGIYLMASLTASILREQVTS